MTVSVTNLRTGRSLCRFADIARSPGERRRGLLNHKTLWVGQGMFFPPPCWMLHTVGMQFGIDILFLQFQNDINHLLVVACVSDLQPENQIAEPRATCALELPAGMIDGSGTEPGDVLEFSYT